MNPPGPSNLIAIVVAASDAEADLLAIIDALRSAELPVLVVHRDSDIAVKRAIETMETVTAAAQHAIAIVAATEMCSRASMLDAGFSAAAASGYSRTLILPPDASAALPGVLAVIAASVDHPSALIIGYRPDSGPLSLWTRFSRLLLRLETGLRLHDIRSGPRIYPLRLFEVVPPKRRGRAGDIELLVRAAWSRCEMVETVTPGAVEDQSAKQTWSERFTETALHARLIARALNGWPHAKFDPNAPRPKRRSLWTIFWQWLNPIPAWREMRRGGGSRNELAAGVAIGVFIANVPTPGLQTLISLYVAKRLHLHPVAVMTGSHASAPPLGPFLIGAAMWLGHFMLHRAPLNWETMKTMLHGKFGVGMWPLLVDWAAGSMFVAIATSIFTYLVCNFTFRLLERRDTSGTLAAKT